MRATPLLRRLAQAGCLVMAGLLVILQLAVTEGSIPWPLFIAFTGLWIFGAAMLWKAPRFGAAGTTLWGLLAGVQSWRMHGVDEVGTALNVAGSLAVATLAGATFVGLVFDRVPRVPRGPPGR